MLKSKSNLKPIGNRVLVKPIVMDQTKTGGGLFLPPIAQRKGQVGEVVGVGAKCKTTIAVGDVVMVTHFTGHEIELAGEKYELLREEDVFGTLINPGDKKGKS